MSESFKCAQCAKCCQTYWITLLPEEAKGISKFLKMPLGKFLQKDCILYLQAFAMFAENPENPLIISAQALPAKIASSLSKKSKAPFFLLLPGIALKRAGKKCVMLSKGLKCKIHDARPGQCRLFPLIGLDEKASLKNSYDFCKGLEGHETANLHENFLHYNKVKGYFEKIKQKGFCKAWPKIIPKEGSLLFGKEKACKISQKEFFNLFEN